MVIWTIGLSAVGKSTLTDMVHQRLKPRFPNLVVLDGDTVRAVLGNDVDHTLEGRRRNAERLAQLTKFMADQGIHVLAAVLSIFPEWRQWMRDRIPSYRQVYLRAPMEVLEERHPANLYSLANAGLEKNVVGVDIPFPEPVNSDLVLDNHGSVEELEAMADKVEALFLSGLSEE